MPLAEILLRSIQGGVERVRRIRLLSASVTTGVLSPVFNKCGVVGSDTTPLDCGCRVVSPAGPSGLVELAARASITKGDGCLGLGTRMAVNEAFSRRRGEASQLLVLALKINTVTK